MAQRLGEPSTTWRITPRPFPFLLLPSTELSMFSSPSMSANGLGAWKPDQTLTYRLPKNNAQTAALRAADVQSYVRKMASSMEASNLHKLAYLMTGEGKPEPTECPVNMEGLSEEMAKKFKDLQLIEERNTWLSDLDRKKTITAHIHLGIDVIGQSLTLDGRHDDVRGQGRTAAARCTHVAARPESRGLEARSSPSAPPPRRDLSAA